MTAAAPPTALLGPVPRAEPALAERLDQALPQTQCTRCGYPDCRAYAAAMASNEAGINRCPPGGHQGIERLATITGRPVLPLDPAHGIEGPRRVAVIDEAWCIGCTLCLKACPVDSIVGGPKLMHIVLDQACNGCELCLPVCPVDCIAMVDVTGPKTGWDAWGPEQADASRRRYAFHRFRVERDKAEHDERLAAGANSARADGAEASKTIGPSLDGKRAVIEAALARARASRHAKPP